MNSNYTVQNAHDINELQLIQVMDDLKSRDIPSATIRPGHNCIWVTHNRILDCYYVFRDGRIVDIQYD